MIHFQHCVSRRTCRSWRSSSSVGWIFFFILKETRDKTADRLRGAWWSAALHPLVKSHWGCRLTPGRMSFHGRNEDVWPNPLFPLIKKDISELSEGEVWVFRVSQWLLADSGLPYPIGSISPLPLSLTVWDSWLLYKSQASTALANCSPFA